MSHLTTHVMVCAFALGRGTYCTLSDRHRGDHGRLPEPCRHCGWQYDDEKLAAALTGEMRLDPNPTHLCIPPVPTFTVGEWATWRGVYVRVIAVDGPRVTVQTGDGKDWPIRANMLDRITQ